MFEIQSLPAVARPEFSLKNIDEIHRYVRHVGLLSLGDQELEFIQNHIKQFPEEYCVELIRFLIQKKISEAIQKKIRLYRGL